MLGRASSFALAALISGCGPASPPAITPPATAPTAEAPPPSTETWPPLDAASGVSDPGLAELLKEHWSFALESSPVWATELGVRRFDGRLQDNSQAAIAARRGRVRGFLERARATASSGELAPADAVTARLLVDELASHVARQVCELELWSVSVRSNPVGEYNYLPEAHTIRGPRDAETLLARYRQIPRSVDDDIDNLRRGAARGLFASAQSVRLTIEMVRRQLAEPLVDWPLLAPARAEHPSLSADELGSLRAGLEETVERAIRPALERYARALETEILPRARGPEAEGVSALPLGAACYAAEIRAHTSLERTAEALHQTGLAEIARIDEELLALGKKTLGARDLPALLVKLRSDPALFFDSAEAILAKARTALTAANARTPAFFGRLPVAPCIVRPIPDYEAPFTTIAYYRPPTPDGSKPGEYFVNVHRPETRPRFEAAVLAFHEAVPGHHLQIAIAQELPAVPAFRKHAQASSYVEGWALYSERLAEEMGLYEGDLDRLGMLSFDAWRAARLVVDTGLHARGWTRKRAERFMLDHTALAEENIRNEVDRYIVWPGQALAYKTGQLEILRLRRRAEAELGAAFDLRAFHDAVLLEGAVTLPVLDALVSGWIASTLRGRTAP